MRLNIIDPTTLDLVGVLTQYESVQWSPTFNTSDGSFQINCSTDYIELLQNDYLIENTKEPEHIGVIKKVQTLSSNQKTSLQVNGIMLEKDIFYKRIVKAWLVHQDMYPTAILNSLIGLSLTEPADPNRKLSTVGEVIFPKDVDVPDMEKTEYSANYPNLGDEVFNLIQNINLGVKARINRDTKKIDIEFYTGNDYTFGSDEPVVFSPERGTVLETNYIKDSSQNITTLVIIGQDNIKLEAERERKTNEPLIEKSIDLSNECPWPTYKVEKSDEDGGQYYRYKKYAPPADFITNRDVWEKYAVDRIETTQTRFREVETEVSRTVTLEEFLSNPELRSNSRLDPNSGLVVGSSMPSEAALNNAILNTAPGTRTTIGIGLRRNEAVNLMSIDEGNEEAVFVDNLVKAPKLAKAKASKNSISKSKNKVGKTTKTGLGKTILSSNIGVIPERLSLEVPRDTSIPIQILATEIQIEQYQVTDVTYETKDFLEYVYVNPGEEPSESTKIVQGSFASGDVMYYENFVDVKIEEAKYKDTLMKKAQEYLKTFVLSEFVEVQPYQLSNMVYGEAYKLGDLVTARNSKFGYTVDLRIAQVTEIWDSKGYNLEIGLGDSIPTLTNRIKLIAKGGV